MVSTKKDLDSKLILYECNYSQDVLFGSLHFAQQCQPHSYWDPFTTNNGQVSSVIGPDTANKLKCVSLCNDTISRSVNDIEINVYEQLDLKIKERDYFTLPMDRST